MSYRALIIGATGAVGSALVRELAAAPACTALTIVARRNVDGLAGLEGAGKISQRRVAMEHLERDVVEAAAGCTVAFCTMGVGQPSKVSREELWRVDVDHAAAFARACKTVGVRHASLLSSAAAASDSRSYYLRVKGNAEREFAAPGFARTSLFRPSLLVTPAIRYGLQDRLTQVGFPLVSWVLPRFHQIRIEDLARAMRLNVERWAATPAVGGVVEVLHYQECMHLLEAERAGELAV